MFTKWFSFFNFKLHNVYIYLKGTVSAQMYLLYEEGIKQYISSSEEFLVQAPKYFGFYDDFEGFNVDELNKIKKVILNKVRLISKLVNKLLFQFVINLTNHFSITFK